MTMCFHWCSVVFVAVGGQKSGLLMIGKVKVEDSIARVMANFAVLTMTDFPGLVNVPVGILGIGRKATPKAKARTGH